MKFTHRNSFVLSACMLLLESCASQPGKTSGSPFRPNLNPSQTFDVYMVGFHPILDDPSRQSEVHHFCSQRSPDFAQCILFDSGMKDANMIGVEYIISEAMFTTLQTDDRKDWHPHNGEILSGQLVAPGLQDTAEQALMKAKMNSYGKSWQFWNPSQGEKLPTGIPVLAWSFNADGQIRPGLTGDRDTRLHLNTAQIRQRRQSLAPDAHPQSGVNRLKGAFGRPETPIPGVIDSEP